MQHFKVKDESSSSAVSVVDVAMLVLEHMGSPRGTLDIIIQNLHFFTYNSLNKNQSPTQLLIHLNTFSILIILTVSQNSLAL